MKLVTSVTFTLVKRLTALLLEKISTAGTAVVENIKLANLSRAVVSEGIIISVSTVFCLGGGYGIINKDGIVFTRLHIFNK
jgi:hypothetical protein